MYQKQARYQEAEAHLQSSAQSLLRESTATRVQSTEVIDRLAALYDAWGKPDKAAEWRAKLAIGWK